MPAIFYQLSLSLYILSILLAFIMVDVFVHNSIEASYRLRAFYLSIVLKCFSYMYMEVTQVSANIYYCGFVIKISGYIRIRCNTISINILTI